MPQVTDRATANNRAFELVLAFAGRLDDDALADVRELLAVAELDRAVGLLVGCLTAGGVPVTDAESRSLHELSGAVLLDGATLARLTVADDTTPARPRFAAGTTAQDPRAGVLPAIDRTLDVLPGVRALHCVWRATAAGTVPGPVPRRVVLVRVEAHRYPAEIAYRIDLAPRRYGLDAGVEVLPEGAELPEYHRAALAEAREIPLRGAVAEVESTETMKPVRDEPPHDSRDDAEAREATPDTGSAAAFDLVDSAPNGKAETGNGVSSAFFGETEFFSRGLTNGTASSTPEQEGDSFAFAPEPAPDRDGELNDTERDLLAQLHAELGKREREQESAFAPPEERAEPGESRHSAESRTAWPSGATSADGDA
jgi:hypothetical protein